MSRINTSHDRVPQSMRFCTGCSFCLGLLMQAAVLAESNPHALDIPTDAELQRLAAPESPIPVRPTSQTERPLPGLPLVGWELEWRVLYDKDPIRRRAAMLCANPGVLPEQLPMFIKQLDAAKSASEIPPIIALQDPRAIPALRRALMRMHDPMARLFLLEALYLCGDWNHKNDLIALLKERSDTTAFRLIAGYYPETAIAIARESLGDTSTAELSPQTRFNLAGTAIDLLTELQYPRRTEVYLHYFENRPEASVAVHLGQLQVYDAAPFIRNAMEDFSRRSRNGLAGGADPKAVNNAYRHALAYLGDPPSVVWLVQSAQMMRTAPRWRDWSAKNAWEKETGISFGDFQSFGRALVKLGMPQTVTAFTDLLCERVESGQETSLTTRVFFSGKPPGVIDALERYFACNGEQEKKWDLTDPKRVLALYPDDPRAKRLFEEFVPDKEKRDGLLLIAREFGKAGMHAGRDFVTTLE